MMTRMKMMKKIGSGVSGKWRGIVTQLMADNPTASKHMLARMLYALHKSEFKNVEAARGIVRNYTGSKGAKQRKDHKGDLMSEAALAKKYGIPVSIKQDYAPFVLQADKVLVLPDIHVPFHDEDALELAIDYGLEYGCETVLLLGDAMDCHKVSRWRNVAPTDLQFRDEVEMFGELLHGLTKVFNKVVWKYGNHEERYEHYLMDKAPEMYALGEFKLSSILGCFQLGIQVVDNKRPIKFDRLTAIHGHEYIGGMTAPVNPARGLFLKGKSIAIQGHQHQTSEHSESTLEGKAISCWSLGCLCQLNPQYMPLNKWNHGFAILDKNSKGGFRVHNKRIINGEVY